MSGFLDRIIKTLETQLGDEEPNLISTHAYVEEIHLIAVFNLVLGPEWDMDDVLGNAYSKLARAANL